MSKTEKHKKAGSMSDEIGSVYGTKYTGVASWIVRRSEVEAPTKDPRPVQRQDGRIPILQGTENQEAPGITVLWVLLVGAREGLDAIVDASIVHRMPQLALVLLRRQVANPSFQRVLRHGEAAGERERATGKRREEGGVLVVRTSSNLEKPKGCGKEGCW